MECMGEGFDKAECLGKERMGFGEGGERFPSLPIYYRSKITLQATAT